MAPRVESPDEPLGASFGGSFGESSGASSATVEVLEAPAREPVAPSDPIRLGLIGAGIIGFVDANAALEIPGTELVAAADCYDGRLTRVNEVYGQDVATTRRYEEVLDRSDVDAVIIATPDHWHQQIAVDALDAGKAVYLEKPMVQRIGQGRAIIDAQESAGQPLIVGSTGVSNVLVHKARKLMREGVVGDLNTVDILIARNSPGGAWQYAIPPDASPETIDWERFVGPAPDRPFDADRFFRWRKYWDYGTGVAGDMFVHRFSSLHYILESKGPVTASASGGIRYWNDGREVPDVILGQYEYPATEHHPDFTLSLKASFADGGAGPRYRIIGNEGEMTVGGTLRVHRNRPQAPPDEPLSEYDWAAFTYSEEVQEQLDRQAAQYRDRGTRGTDRFGGPRVYRTPEGYSDRHDHFVQFFNAIRTGRPIVEDATFGYRAAASALLANKSYREDRVVHWDPDAMQLREPAAAAAASG